MRLVSRLLVEPEDPLSVGAVDVFTSATAFTILESLPSKATRN